jgi:hypothetical protein
VFARVARAARQVLPFDTMGVSVAHDPEVPFEDFENARFSAYAAEGAAQVEEIGEYRRSDVSPALRLKDTGKVSRYPPSPSSSCLRSTFWWRRPTARREKKTRSIPRWRSPSSSRRWDEDAVKLPGDYPRSAHL